MAKVALNRTQIFILTLVFALIGGAAFIYQKFFGGKAQSLPQGEFLVGKANKEKSMTEEKKEEPVAVAQAETPAKGVQTVIARTRDLDFIKPGDKVLVKPNVNSDDPAPGTTHPEALGEVVRLAKARGAYVIVGDRSNPRWKTIPAMKETGIYQAAQEAGADEIVGFEDEDWIRVKPEGSLYWPNGFRVPKRLAGINHIISVPVLHTHSIAGHSLAIKNLVGLIHPADRGFFHASGKAQEMITEISLAIKPALNIIEGTKAFIDGGPSQGTLVEPKVYLASKDVLLADLTGIKLLNQAGAQLPIWDSPQITHGLTLNLSSYQRNILEAELEKI